MPQRPPYTEQQYNEILRKLNRGAGSFHAGLWLSEKKELVRTYPDQVRNYIRLELIGDSTTTAAKPYMQKAFEELIPHILDRAEQYARDDNQAAQALLK